MNDERDNGDVSHRCDIVDTAVATTDVEVTELGAVAKNLKSLNNRRPFSRSKLKQKERRKEKKGKIK